MEKIFMYTTRFAVIELPVCIFKKSKLIVEEKIIKIQW